MSAGFFTKPAFKLVFCRNISHKEVFTAFSPLHSHQKVLHYDDGYMEFVVRHAEETIRRLVSSFPAVLVVGARQTGK
ncbi:MAG TPA: hypothetical protein DCO86_04030 [Spirochaetaceae bacterium]|nr:hypothetical protein [Spirochaetaceae bacterium]